MAPQPSKRLLGIIAFFPLLFVCADNRKADAPADKATASKMVRLRVGPGDAAQALAFSPDGKLLVGADGGSILLWDVPRGTQIGRSRIPSKGALSEVCRFIAISPDGKRLVTVHDTRQLDIDRARIRLWDLAGGSAGLIRMTRIRLPLGPDYGSWPVAFSPDGKTLVAANFYRRSLLLWDVATGRELLHFHGGRGAGFAPDGRSLISVGAYGRFHHWAAGTNRLLDTRPQGKPTEAIAAQHIVFTQDARQAAIGDGYSIWLKDTATGATLHRLEGAGGEFKPLQFSPNGRSLTAVNGPGMSLFDTANGKEIGWVRGPAIGAFSPDGRTFARAEEGAVILEDTSFFRAGAGKAPPPAATEPPGVPLQAELIANRKTYSLDLGGLTAEEFAEEMFDNQIAEPKLDLTLRLRNTGDRPLRLHSWKPKLECTAISLVGPGAINFFQSVQTGILGTGRNLKPFDIRLRPGATYCTPVSKLRKFAGDNVFWASPGEYRLRADVWLDVSPAPKGTTANDDGFGYVRLRCPPLALRVEAPKAGKRREKYAGGPRLGSVVPPPEDDATCRLRQRLDQRIILDKGLEAGKPLKDVMEFFHDRYEIEWCLDEAAFGRLGKKCSRDTKTNALPPMAEVPMEAVLYLLLNPLGADYAIRDGKLWIVPLAKPKNLADCLGNSRRWFREKLEEPEMKRGGIPPVAPLREVLDALSLRLDCLIIIDAPAFARAGFKGIDKKLARLTEQTNVPRRTILERLLKPLGAALVVRDNLVVVVPAPAKGR